MSESGEGNERKGNGARRSRAARCGDGSGVSVRYAALPFYIGRIGRAATGPRAVPRVKPNVRQACTSAANTGRAGEPADTVSTSTPVSVTSTVCSH